MSREPCSKCDSSDKEHYCGHCERCNDCCPDWEAHGRMVGMAKKSFDSAWNFMKSEPVRARYRSLPEDSQEGEHTWKCPHCGEENEEWSSHQSFASPFRFNNKAKVQCASCGERVQIMEG